MWLYSMSHIFCLSGHLSCLSGHLSTLYTRNFLHHEPFAPDSSTPKTCTAEIFYTKRLLLTPEAFFTPEAFAPGTIYTRQLWRLLKVAAEEGCWRRLLTKGRPQPQKQHQNIQTTIPETPPKYRNHHPRNTTKTQKPPPHPIFTQQPFTSRAIAPGKFGPADLYTRNLLYQKTPTPGAFLHQELLHQGPFTQDIFTPEQLYTRRLWHQKPFYTRRLQKPLYTRTFYTSNHLDQTGLRQEGLYTRNLLYQKTPTPGAFLYQKLLHQGPFTRHLDTKTPWHQKTLTPEAFLHQKPLYTTTFYTSNHLHHTVLHQEDLYTRNLLHQKPPTPGAFLHQKLLHQGPFTQDIFTPEHLYTRNRLHQKTLHQKPLYTRTFYTSNHLYRPDRFAPRRPLHQKSLAPEASYAGSLFTPETFTPGNIYTRHLSEHLYTNCIWKSCHFGGARHFGGWYRKPGVSDTPAIFGC